MAQKILDLHLHSKYARACSPQLTLENIANYCDIKGVDVVASADFTHPLWFNEMQKNLAEDTAGIYRLKNSAAKTRFLLSTEVSCIYSQGGPADGGVKKVRRLHILIFAPNLETVAKINQALAKAGAKLAGDGRPIMGLSARQLVEIVWGVSSDCFIIPAHAWTPWFAVFGSKSGFDSLEECFGNYAKNIYAIETGLSSDPAMNWRWSALDNITLVSNSDAHSLPNIGREANVFDLDQITYAEVCRIIREKDRQKFLYTIEFYPEEGMYHYDGHRACGVSFKPSETKKFKNICPVCKKPLTLGVSYRVEELADRPEGFILPEAIPYKNLVELDKIIAEALDVKSRQSKQVQAEYDNLVKHGKSEMNILLNATYDELAGWTEGKIVEGIRRMREGQLIIKPGFDGEYGQIEIFKPEERGVKSQKKLF